MAAIFMFAGGWKREQVVQAGTDDLRCRSDYTHQKDDISLAADKLNWTPQVTSENGLKDTILYFEQLLNKSK